MKSAFRNWSDVRVFLAVVREGSTLAASRVLGIAQPTVARRIEALEHELGLTLFERDTRGFRLADTARALVPLAEKIEAAAAAFADESLALSRPRPIRITAFTSNFSPRTAQIYSAFTALHPGVEFEFLPSTKVFDLLGGEADIALRLTRSPPEPSLISRKISTARFTLYGTRAYADKHGLPSSPDELDSHSFVTFRRGDAPSVLHDWIAARVPPERIVGTYGEIELLTAAMKAGLALGLDNVRRCENDPELIPCFDPPEELNAEHLILITPEAYRRPEVKAFTRFFAPRYAALYR